MCTFVNEELPLTTGADGDGGLKRMELYVRPSEPNEFYRMRLLWFRDKSSRTGPFIERYIHTYWETKVENDGKEKWVSYQIVCPTSKFVEWQGNPFDDCPICRFSNNNFISWKESKYTDKIAGRHARGFKRAWEALVPVYVISDPNWDKNNQKFRVLSFSDRDTYNRFRRIIIDAQQNKKLNVFNGVDAVDFVIRAEKVTKVKNEGTEKEYTYNAVEVKQMGFSKTPYTIGDITAENIETQFPLAELYYTGPTLNELKTFYKKYCLQQRDDDIDVSELEDVGSSNTKTTVQEGSGQPRETDGSKDTAQDPLLNQVGDDPDNMGLSLDDLDLDDEQETKSTQPVELNNEEKAGAREPELDAVDAEDSDIIDDLLDEDDDDLPF